VRRQVLDDQQIVGVLGRRSRGQRPHETPASRPRSPVRQARRDRGPERSAFVRHQRPPPGRERIRCRGRTLVGSAAGRRGHSTVKVEPRPSVLATTTHPPNNSPYPWTMDRPNPIPAWRRFSASSTCSNGAKIRSNRSAECHSRCRSRARAGAGWGRGGPPGSPRPIPPRSPDFGEFHGVAEQIGQDRLERLGVGRHRAAARPARRRRPVEPTGCSSGSSGVTRASTSSHTTSGANAGVYLPCSSWV